jgi:hypothetical protein
MGFHLTSAQIKKMAGQAEFAVQVSLKPRWRLVFDQINEISEIGKRRILREGSRRQPIWCDNSIFMP